MTCAEKRLGIDSLNAPDRVGPLQEYRWRWSAGLEERLGRLRRQDGHAKSPG